MNLLFVVVNKSKLRTPYAFKSILEKIYFPNL